MVLFSSGGFTKLADRMEAEGLIKRVACPDDRRSSLATITPKGRRILDRGLRVHLPSLDKHLLANLDDTQRVQLEAILRTLRDGACDVDPDCDEDEQCREIPAPPGGVPYKQCMTR